MTCIQISASWAITDGPDALKGCTLKDLGMLVTLGFLYFSSQIAYIYGIALSSASLCALMQCLNPAITIALAVCLGFEVLSWKKALAMFYGIVGTALISVGK